MVTEFLNFSVAKHEFSVYLFSIINIPRIYSIVNKIFITIYQIVRSLVAKVLWNVFNFCSSEDDLGFVFTRAKVFQTFPKMVVCWTCHLKVVQCEI